MKAYIVFERDDYNETGKIYKEGYSTAEEAYKMVKTFLLDDYETYNWLSEESYNRQIKRLEKSYDSFLKGERSYRFGCKYYIIEEINIKEKS